MSSFSSVEGAIPKSTDPGPDVDRHVAGGPLRSHVGLHKPGAGWSEMIRPASDLSIMTYFIIANQQASGDQTIVIIKIAIGKLDTM